MVVPDSNKFHIDGSETRVYELKPGTKLTETNISVRGARHEEYEHQLGRHIVLADDGEFRSGIGRIGPFPHVSNSPGSDDSGQRRAERHAEGQSGSLRDPVARERARPEGTSGGARAVPQRSRCRQILADLQPI